MQIAFLYTVHNQVYIRREKKPIIEEFLRKESVREIWRILCIRY